MAKVPQGGDWRDMDEMPPKVARSAGERRAPYYKTAYGRMHADRPAPTLVTELHWSKGRFLHPTLDRHLTIREAALLQGFPDDYLWTGSKTSIVRQIGNAVPPPTAELLAQAVKVAL